jgi:hypothetical protein
MPTNDAQFLAEKKQPARGPFTAMETASEGTCLEDLASH